MDEQLKILMFFLDDRMDEAELIIKRLEVDHLPIPILYTDADKFIKDFIVNSVDLTILDFKLSGEKTGLDVLKEISGVNMHCKHIVVSGRSDLKVANQFYRNGAFDYIDKNEPDYLIQVSDSIKRVLPIIQKRLYYEKKYAI